MSDPELNEEQQLLRDSIDRFIEREYAFDVHRQATASEDGFRRDVWKRFGELGWLGVGLPERVGGSGGARDIAVVMESLGRGLVVEPFLACVVMAGKAVALAGSASRQEELLPDVISGNLLLSLAHAEPRSRYNPARVSTRAEPSGSGWILNGRKSLVLNGDTADRFVVSARTGGGRDTDESGITLLTVPASNEGVEVRGYPTNDGRRAAEIQFDNVELGGESVLGDVGEAFPHISEVIDRAAAAVCAESLGLMAVLNDLTVDYSKTREQFGQPIGRFQALQHRMVDMFIALEESRSLVAVCMASVDSADASERQRAVSAMKVQCDKAGRLVGQEAVQLHGGIAMTDDYMASHYFKRLSVIHRQFGDIDWHLERYADLAL